MAKRLTEKQIQEIIKCFKEGKTIENLSNKFGCTKLTISRKLKKILGEKQYKEILRISDDLIQNSNKKEKILAVRNEDDRKIESANEKYPYTKETNNNIEEELFPMTPFIEITPLNYEIENSPRKDLSSVPISDINFPKIVYMIVDKKIELVIKDLKDYPDWQFLSKDELNRKTIEIHLDLKKAKKFCNKEQKVIKVPNTDVFKVVAPILLSRGISRIVSPDQLIAL